MLQDACRATILASVLCWLRPEKSEFARGQVLPAMTFRISLARHTCVRFVMEMPRGKSPRRMLESFNFRAMANAQLFAEQMERIGALARVAKNPGVTPADLVGIVGTVADLAARGQASAELDSKCMNYALSLGPHEIEEFEQLMETAEIQAAQH